MSVILNKISELRYLRRKNLDEEAKLVGNWYRDIIRSYGCDVNYYKLNTNVFGDYKGIVDQNVLIRHAYGYDVSPDYSISALMLSYMEVEQDIFQINKFGYNPEANVTFYFDSNDFACALASKLGQYKEVKIDETEIVCEIPEITNEKFDFKDYHTHKLISLEYLSSSIFPYKLGFGRNEFYCADMLSGKFLVDIPWYEFDKELTIECDAYEHSVMSAAFKANPSLYKTFYHNYQNSDYLLSMLYLTFTVKKTTIGKKVTKLKEIDPIINISDAKQQVEFCNKYLDIESEEINDSVNSLIRSIEHIKEVLGIDKSTDQQYLSGRNLKKIIIELKFVVEECKKRYIVKDIYKCILYGKLHGSVLFYDLNKVGKYIDKIHPEVGDIITIDFPDENNREQYEITDAFDKSFQSDGISPLLHKYIWKCAARRHIDNYNNVEHNEANDRLEEKIKFAQVVDNQIVNEYSIYDDNQDAVYGGYGNAIFNFDKNVVNNETLTKYEWIDDGTALDIMTFDCGSKLMTTGYELLFMTDNKDVYKVTTLDRQLVVKSDVYTESNLKYLKATDDALVFINILGDAYKLAENIEVTDGKLLLNIESLFDKTTDDESINDKVGSFYKFKNTRTYLFATRKHLFCKLAGNNKTYLLI